MAYTLEDCRGTKYAVDWDVIARLRKSYWLSEYQLYHSRVVTMSESTWYNPFSWSLPSVKTVEVDWPRVREETNVSVFQDIYAFRSWAATDMRRVVDELLFGIEMTAQNKRRFRTQLSDTQQSNSQAIQDAVESYDGMIEAAKFVRDTSADVVIIGSTIASGGAAAALLAGGSAMKGVGKYQDTGSAGAAVLYGAGTLVLGRFKIGGASLTGGQEWALIVAKGMLEAGTSLAAGDSFGKAVGKGALKIASAGTAQLLFSPEVMKKLFEKMPVPFTVMNVTSKEGQNLMMTDTANKLVQKTVKKLTEKGSKVGYAAGVDAIRGENGSNGATRRTSSGFVDDVPFADRALVNLAVVNMEKGVGRGW